MRGLDFWKNYRYAICIEFQKADGTIEKHYVTEIDNETKTFEFKSWEEIKKNKIKVLSFTAERAIDLMNSMVCNGFCALIFPYFGD